MNNIAFVPHKMAISLSEIGISTEPLVELSFSGVFEWFDSLFIYGFVDKATTNSNSWGFSYKVEYLPKESQEDKRRSLCFLTIHSYENTGGMCYGVYENRRDAEIACIEKMIEVFKMVPKTN